MCGIAGISISPTDTINTRVLGAELLLRIESRGRQATGAAWLNGDTVDVTKLPVTAKTFLSHREDNLPESTPVMILHTRYGTHGDGSNRLNLHPVHHERIIGVHNGVLRNHKKLFAAAGRKPTADVDTEGLMAILNTDKHPTEVLGQMEGDAAIAWLDLEDPGVLHLACVTGRPLCIAQTEGGSLIFASTALAIKDAARTAKLKLVFEDEVKEETYLKVVGGVIVESKRIKGVKHSDAAFRSKYAWTSGKDSKPPVKQPAASKPTTRVTNRPSSAYEADLAAARAKSAAMAADARTPAFSGQQRLAITVR